MLTWSEAAAALAPWRNYWVGTAGLDGAPHAAPVWGVVVDGVLYFYTERTTVKARNLAADPRVVVHLESGDDVVLVRGRAEFLGSPAGCREVVAAFAAKYTERDDQQYLPGPADVVNDVYALRPASAHVWRLADYDGSQRRWAATPTVSDDSS